MTGLLIFLGIILFFVILLSIRITITGEFFDEFKLAVSWLFIKIPILPAKKKEAGVKKEKKPKKEKAPKEEKVSKEPELESEEPPKENIFVRFYNNQGYEGVLQLINNVVASLGKMFNSFRKHIVIRELFLFLTVTGGCDAAETAINYGKTCQKVFPAMSFICTKLPVKKYDVEIEPDFLGTKNTAQFAFSVHIRPIFFINAVFVLVFRLIFKVALKFLMGIKKKTNKENINKGGTK